MRAYTLTHLSDAELLHGLGALVARDRETTAALLAPIAEVDARRLYVPAAYPSMHAYCVGELHLSDNAAYKRIQAARAGRRFPLLFAAVADGRLHLAAVCLLSPHLEPDNVEELIAAATHRGKAGIEAWLAKRLPRPDLPGFAEFEPAPGKVVAAQLAPGQVMAAQLAPGQVTAPSAAASPRPADRVVLHVAIRPDTGGKLQYARALLGHAVPSGDVAEVLDRALDALIAQLERRKFAATKRPREPQAARGGSPPPKPVRPRSIPAPVRHAVWQRDAGRCTFVSAAGRRCAADRRIEFDHVTPVARGGRATVEGMRLRCRAHNQYAAEQAFGVEFMQGKREEARHERTSPRAPRQADDDLRAGLRALGLRADEARHAAEYAATLGVMPLEERLRAALQFVGRCRFPRAVARAEAEPVLAAP